MYLSMCCVTTCLAPAVGGVEPLAVGADLDAGGKALERAAAGWLYVWV